MIAFMLKITTQPGQRDEVTALVRTLFDELSNEEAFVEAAISAAADEPDQIIIFERWNESRDAFLERLKTYPTYQAHNLKLQPPLSNRDITFLDPNPI